MVELYFISDFVAIAEKKYPTCFYISLSLFFSYSKPRFWNCNEKKKRKKKCATDSNAFRMCNLFCTYEHKKKVEITV